MASSSRNRTGLLVALLAVATAYALFYHLRQGALSTSRSAADAATFEPHEVPKLETHLLTRDLVGSGDSPRNPFTYGPPPTPTRDMRPTPTPPPPPTPRPPPPTRTPGPSPTPLPPPFDRIYIGYLGPKRLPVAVFRRDEQVEVAVPGFVFDNRFILREVGYESVVIGFVGYPEEVTTRVPLAEN
jgi:hypothetical protein